MSTFTVEATKENLPNPSIPKVTKEPTCQTTKEAEAKSRRNRVTRSKTQGVN